MTNAPSLTPPPPPTWWTTTEERADPSLYRKPPTRGAVAGTVTEQGSTTPVAGAWVTVMRTYDHQPVAEDGVDCICLAVTDAPLRLTGCQVDVAGIGVFADDICHLQCQFPHRLVVFAGDTVFQRPANRGTQFQR